MAYDDIIPLLGGFGRYQRRIYFLICLPALVCAFHKFGNVFLVAKAAHRCRLPDELENASYELPESVWYTNYPYDNATQQYSSCKVYDRNGDETSCETYIYDHTVYETSAYFEWNMVCGRAYMKSTGDSLFMVGIMFGSMIFGELSDRYGRKLIFFVALVIQLIFGVIASLAPEYWTFTFTRAIVGATTQGVFLVAYVIAMEMVSPKRRLIAGTVCQMVFSVGYLLVAPMAYYITQWRHLQLALTLPGLLFFSYWWFIPESARWLISKRRIPEAKSLIFRAAKENKIKIDESTIDSLLISDVKQPDPDEKKPSILDVFKHPNLRKRSLIIFFDWFANSITYYGLSWNTSNLGGNDYLNFVISAAVELPAYTFCIFTLNRWGRKKMLCGCMVAAGIALLLTMAVPDGTNWLVVTLAMIGKLAITASYGTIYIFSTEQFPTVIRNAALGAGSVAARMGSIFAPFINETSSFFKPLPLIIFGILSLTGGILSLLLPETLNRRLPETIADGEMFGRKDTSVEILEDEDTILNKLTPGVGSSNGTANGSTNK